MSKLLERTELTRTYSDEVLAHVSGERIFNVVEGALETGQDIPDLRLKLYDVGRGSFVVTQSRLVFMFIKGGLLSRGKLMFRDVLVSDIAEQGLTKGGDSVLIYYDSGSYRNVWHCEIRGSDGGRDADAARLLSDTIAEAAAFVASQQASAAASSLDKLREERGF